jgi:hypothetical protein
MRQEDVFRGFFFFFSVSIYKKVINIELIKNINAKMTNKY